MSSWDHLKQKQKHRNTNMDNISIHVKNFNERVKAMNQTQSRELIMSAQDARSLHADIFAILAHVTELSSQLRDGSSDVVQISVDGGGFK
jgi:hypothetical protein